MKKTIEQCLEEVGTSTDHLDDYDVVMLRFGDLKKAMHEFASQSQWIAVEELSELIKEIKHNQDDLLRFIDDGCVEVSFYGNNGFDVQEKFNGKDLLKKYITDIYKPLPTAPEVK